MSGSQTSRGCGAAPDAAASSAAANSARNARPELSATPPGALLPCANQAPMAVMSASSMA